MYPLANKKKKKKKRDERDTRKDKKRDRKRDKGERKDIEITPEAETNIRVGAYVSLSILLFFLFFPFRLIYLILIFPIFFSLSPPLFFFCPPHSTHPPYPPSLSTLPSSYTHSKWSRLSDAEASELCTVV